ncbi:hypothetical protein ACFPRL_02315 [Pseudoclavibacter helvolus]
MGAAAPDESATVGLYGTRTSPPAPSSSSKLARTTPDGVTGSPVPTPSRVVSSEVTASGCASVAPLISPKAPAAETLAVAAPSTPGSSQAPASRSLSGQLTQPVRATATAAAVSAAPASRMRVRVIRSLPVVLSRRPRLHPMHPASGLSPGRSGLAPFRP